MNLFECRVDQDIRLIYEIKDGYLICKHIDNHDAAYDFASQIRFKRSKIAGTTNKPKSEPVVTYEILTVEEFTNRISAHTYP